MTKKPAARKRKQPSLFRKVFMGPPAAIVAAIIGGVFSLTSAVVRALPTHEDSHAIATLEPADSTLPCGCAHYPIALSPDREATEQADSYASRLSAWFHGEAVEHTGEMAANTPEPTEWITYQPFEIRPQDTSQSTAEPNSKPTPRQVERAVDALAGRSIDQALARAEAQSPAPRGPAAKKRPNLTYGVWTIFASKDSRGTVWNNSTLKITSQRETPDGLQIAGYLDWRAKGNRAGREFVVGNYVDETRSLFIEGYQSAGGNRQTALVACSARLSEDERRLTGGTWGSATGHRPAVPGNWEARR